MLALDRYTTAAAARSLLNAVSKAGPFKVLTLLTENGKEFADPLVGKRAREAGAARVRRAVREPGHRAPADQVATPADPQYG